MNLSTDQVVALLNFVDARLHGDVASRWHEDKRSVGAALNVFEAFQVAPPEPTGMQVPEVATNVLVAMDLEGNIARVRVPGGSDLEKTVLSYLRLNAECAFSVTRGTWVNRPISEENQTRLLVAAWKYRVGLELPPEAMVRIEPPESTSIRPNPAIEISNKEGFFL